MKKGWQTKTIGDVCEVIAGQSPEGKFYNADGEGIPFYQGKKDFGDKFIEAPTTWTTHTTKIAREGDILMSVRAPVGPINFSTAEVCIGRGLAAIRSTAELNRDFLFYQLWHLQPAIAGREGAVFASINKSEIEALPLAFAPLPEQQRIVAILDEAFEGIATAKANAEKNLQNARALFESHLHSVFTQRGEGWVEKQLGDIAEFKNGLNFTRQSNGQTLRIVGVGDFQDLSVVPIETLQSVTIDGKIGDDYLIRRDDILTVRSNGSRDLVGRCMLVPDVEEPISFSGFIIRLRFDTRVISPRFLLHFMKSSATRDRLTRDGGGANISNINQAKLSELPISLPSLKQQKDIASRLDALHEETQRLTSVYEHKLAALESLKKSLLHQAFNGELTENSAAPNILSFPRKLSGISTTDLHAGILAMAYQLHEDRGKQDSFGHVKAEKIAHMVEAYVGIDLERQPVKDAAGPNDFPHLIKVESRARKASFFNFQRETGLAYRVRKLGRFHTLISQVQQALGTETESVSKLLDLMLPMDAQQAEIFATVYAGWNNLLLDGKNPTDEEIVHESRENWHPDKLKIDRQRFFIAIGWLREKSVVPQGRGKRVLPKGD